MGLDLDLDFGCLESLDFENERSEASRKLKSESTAKIFLEAANINESYIKKNRLVFLGWTLENLELPRPGYQFRIRTQQQINLISILLKIIDTHKTIDELIIATYTLNPDTLKIIGDLLKAKTIKKMSFIVSSSYSFRYPDYYKHLKKVFLDWHIENKHVHLAFCWSHFKITLVKCGDNYYQHEGSMNYSVNNLAENLSFENDKKLYKQDEKFLKETILEKKHKAIEVIC